MRAFIPNGKDQYRYPEDMETIVSYLNEHGQVNVSEKTLEILYERFSENIYCAGWMGLDEEVLAEFAEWLSKIEIERIDLC